MRHALCAARSWSHSAGTQSKDLFSDRFTPSTCPQNYQLNIVFILPKNTAPLKAERNSASHSDRDNCLRLQKVAVTYEKFLGELLDVFSYRQDWSFPVF